MTSIILRVERNERYKTVHLKACDDDTRLSWKAAGILWYLISRPDGWEFNREDLVGRHTDGITGVKAGLAELRDAGYLRIERVNGEGGRFVGYCWIVSERPMTNAELAERQKPAPLLDNHRRLENRPTENKPHSKKKPSSTRAREGGEPADDAQPSTLDAGQELLPDSPEVMAFIAEVRRLCGRVGVTSWPLRTQTMNEWCREVAADVRYAGLTLAHEAQRCGEWWEPRLKRGQHKAPHLTLRRWLDRAVKICAEDGHAAMDPQERFVQDELERQRELRAGGHD